MAPTLSAIAHIANATSPKGIAEQQAMSNNNA